MIGVGLVLVLLVVVLGIFSVIHKVLKYENENDIHNELMDCRKELNALRDEIKTLKEYINNSKERNAE